MRGSEAGCWLGAPDAAACSPVPAVRPWGGGGSHQQRCAFGPKIRFWGRVEGIQGSTINNRAPHYLQGLKQPQAPPHRLRHHPAVSPWVRVTPAKGWGVFRGWGAA